MWTWHPPNLSNPVIEVYREIGLLARLFSARENYFFGLLQIGTSGD